MKIKSFFDGLAFYINNQEIAFYNIYTRTINFSFSEIHIDTLTEIQKIIQQFEV